MIISKALRRVVHAGIAAMMFVWLGAGFAAEPDPKSLTYTLPENIKWIDNASGSRVWNVIGDPSKPEMYVVVQIWTKGHMSRPHSHPNDRYITVLKGTWWVGTGPKYDPASTFPMKAGTVVKHLGKGIHYDGAKDEDAWLQIVGMGPATSTNAEQK